MIVPLPKSVQVCVVVVDSVVENVSVELNVLVELTGMVVVKVVVPS